MIISRPATDHKRIFYEPHDKTRKDRAVPQKSGSRQSGLTNSVSFDNYHRIKPTTSRPAPTTLRKRTIAETSKGVYGEQVMERALSEGRVLITEDPDCC